MTAIVTNKFRVANAESFKNIIRGTDDSVFVAIAKSDVWSDSISDNTDAEAPTPTDSFKLTKDFHNNMIAMKLLTSSDVVHVIPRYDWVSGGSYVPWDDQDPDIFDKEFYIVTDEFKVYKCVNSGTGGSVIKPTHTNINTPVQEADGYVWKYMYTVQAIDADKFLTTSFIPVKTVTIPEGGSVGDLTTDDQTQYSAQQAAIAGTDGGIYRIVITNGGSGYSTKPTVNIIGDGSGASVVAAGVTMNGDAVESIEVDASGLGYKNAVIEITGDGVGAEAYAVITPSGGHGADPVRELGAYFVAVNAKLDGDEGDGDFVINSTFRQVGIIKNPFDNGTTDISTASTLSGLSSLSVTGHSGFQVGDYITGQTSGAIAYIDFYDDVLGVLKIHQNDKTGFRQFQAAETVVGSLGGTGVISAINNPEYERFTGEILFVESRDPILRNATQIEDIKVIIEF